MKIRTATQNDIDDLFQLEAVCALHPWTRRALLQSLEHPLTTVWRLGTSAYCIERVVVDEAEIFSIGVHPRARRQGLARDLLSQVVHSWVERGAKSAYLEVREANHPARGLYRATGWSEMNTRPNYYGPGEHGICMRRTL